MLGLTYELLCALEYLSSGIRIIRAHFYCKPRRSRGNHRRQVMRNERTVLHFGRVVSEHRHTRRVAIDEALEPLGRHARNGTKYDGRSFEMGRKFVRAATFKSLDCHDVLLMDERPHIAVERRDADTLLRLRFA